MSAVSLRNFRLAASTALEHAGVDPTVLALQAARRLPASVVDPVVRVSAKLPGLVLPAMAAVIRGDHAESQARLQAAAGAGPRARTAVRLADVATAAGYPELSGTLLKSVPAGTRGRAAADARLLWYQGEMSRAVDTLAEGKGAEHRMRLRLASELEVFSGWQPVLEPVPDYRPRSSTVLHLLTNSLPHTGSGYAQRSHSLLNAQAEQGWDVHAVTRLGYPVQVGALTARVRDVIDAVTYHRLLSAALPRGMAARLQLQTEQLLALAVRLRPAVLHTTTHFVNGIVVRAVAQALGIPWVYEVRGQLADTWASTRGPLARNSERYRLFTACEASLMRSAPAVATLGENMLQGILATGVLREKTVLLPNAVGEDFLKPPVAPQDARRSLDLPVPGVTLGTVSSLVAYEGIDDLIRAFALLARGYPELSCLIVGDGAAGPGLKTLAADLGVGDRVIFTGKVPRHRAHLYHQAIDIFVVPRKDLDVTRAVTPLKPVEAMASGTPVVASSLPALGELVRDGEDGVLARPGDPVHLAKRLEMLIGDASLREEMGARGRTKVLSERTWTAVAQTSVALYGSLLTEGRTA
ncbi:glycosyltransferase family 4 protein [Arthrobacter sp. zg-Y916]|uniref:glycosyltransferase family 4 protein n=1 Tax=Arthrobacter sp. zg-Y916 TaxID=2894190 RepID=UPI001E36572D|nr:glycosyltransferase family 4 protein [Arthrobacter sp. zg-Y916]MCC9193855.1 glycosyltransferase family 4 protein [Arthrobacter sp. zg-Y916]